MESLKVGKQSCDSLKNKSPDVTQGLRGSCIIEREFLLDGNRNGYTELNYTIL